MMVLLCLMSACLVAAIGISAAKHWRAQAVIVAWRFDESLKAVRAQKPVPPSSNVVPAGQDSSSQLSMLVAEVAARLRAGMPTAEAWMRAWDRVGSTHLGSWEGIAEDGVPRSVARLARAPSWRDVRRDVLGLVRQRDALSWRHLVSSCGRLRRRSTVSERVSRRSAHTLSVACRLTQELGTPLAEVLDIVADSIDEAAAAEDARAIARSGPLTSARILTALPVAGIALGQLIGANPLERFCDGGIGTISAIIGTVCLIAGRLVSTRMITRTIDISEGVDPATMCDLTIAGMNAGASVPSIVRTLGRVSNDAELERIGSELVLGARWGDAWNPHPANAALLADVLEPAWSDGTSPVPLLTRAARQVRARRIAHAKSEAERLAVRLVIPLGALLLPSFIALGVVPILLHIGTNTFGGLW